MNRKVKVLYVVDSLKIRFGVTSVVMNYLVHMPEDIQIDFLAFEDSEKEVVQKITGRGSKVFFMPRLSLSSINAFVRHIDHFFAEHRDYQIIHSHFNQVDSLVFKLARKYSTPCCISHSHSTKYSDYKLKSIRNWILCLPLKHSADVWGACGVKAGEFLYGKRFLASPKHLVIHNAIDTELFRFNAEVRKEVRKELDFEDDIFVIGHIGSLKPVKNQSFIINVFNVLMHCENVGRKCKLLIVGDGGLKDELHDLVNRLGLDGSVIFAGMRKDAHRLYQAMDLYLLPSLYEGVPVTGVEAQAAGLPCLFSDAVTTEIDMINCKYLRLKNNVDGWVSEIKNHIDKELPLMERCLCADIVKEKGFDISKEAVRLGSFYLQKAGN